MEPLVMKADIHPNYHEITVVMTDGTEYKTRTTWGKAGDVMKLDIDSLSHPAWKGGTAKIMEKGQLSKFEKKFGSFLSAGVQTAGRQKEEEKEEKQA
jgi:large subunit ribosomal protein L31